jgi:hypothetical protein
MYVSCVAGLYIKDDKEPNSNQLYECLKFSEKAFGQKTASE